MFKTILEKGRLLISQRPMPWVGSDPSHKAKVSTGCQLLNINDVVDFAISSAISIGLQKKTFFRF